jgi:hypothetical protein
MGCQGLESLLDAAGVALVCFAVGWLISEAIKHIVGGDDQENER